MLAGGASWSTLTLRRFRTDFDTSDRLYFEPLDEESVLDILENEGVAGQSGSIDCPPSVVQFGGQTAINLSQILDRAAMPILGSPGSVIDAASDRRRFNGLMDRLGIPQPPGATVTSLEEGLSVAQALGFPLLVRPSYVLGGQAMEVVDTVTALVRYLSHAVAIGQGKPILIDKYIRGREVEVDAICDGENVLIPGIMAHVERAGVHSGDSMAVYPAITLNAEEATTVIRYAKAIGLGLGVLGLMNIQFVVTANDGDRDPQTFDPKAPTDSSVYVIEVNPRSSRTIPFISKVSGVPMIDLATRVILGNSLQDMGWASGLHPRRPLVGVKAPVFSMSKLGGVDTYLGPEMKSTGEVMGIDAEYRPALAKALIAANLMLPTQGSLLVTIADRDKPEAIPWLKLLHKLGYRLLATTGTAALIHGLGIPVEHVNKSGELTPNAVSVIADGTVDGVVNTVAETAVAMRDGFEIRRAATERRIPCYTSTDTIRSVVEALSYGGLDYGVHTTAEYLRGAAPNGSRGPRGATGALD